MTKYRIVPKRDFGGGKGFYIKGEYVKSGYIVTDGFCNIMPAATWFRNIPDALRALDVWIGCHGDALKRDGKDAGFINSKGQAYLRQPSHYLGFRSK